MKTGEKMSDKELRDQLMTLFLAGHETTALTLTFTFYLLAQHARSEAELHAEVDRVLGGRLPTAPRRGQAALHRVGHQGIHAALSARMDHRPRGIGGLRNWRLPGPQRDADSHVPMGRAPRSALLERTGPFNPDRWGEEATKNLPRCAYFPFGDGPRICIGSSFAMMEAILAVGDNCPAFNRLELVQGQELQLVPSVTMPPRDGIQDDPTRAIDARSAIVDAVDACKKAVRHDIKEPADFRAAIFA